MDSRNVTMAMAKQQYVMTSINNLALLLGEALQKMNEDVASCKSAKPGNKSCNKPGGKGKGKKSAKNMKDMQDGIGKQLGKLKAGLEAAKKDGKDGKEGQSQMSRELAKLAAQQEALRNEMQKYQDEMGTKGVKDQGGMNDAARDMEQVEKDLINKRITQETINRQQNIMTRLLESEKAEQMRDQEEKRESTEAKTQQNSNPGLNYQYNIKKRASQDNIQLVLPGINSFYKSKVSSYIVKIEN
jgi:vacuolar-type H+-ATPase subunit I/STV1